MTYCGNSCGVRNTDGKMVWFRAADYNGKRYLAEDAARAFEESLLTKKYGKPAIRLDTSKRPHTMRGSDSRFKANRDR